MRALGFLLMYLMYYLINTNMILCTGFSYNAKKKKKKKKQLVIS